MLSSQNVESTIRPALLLSSANGKLNAARVGRDIQQFIITDDVYTSDFHDCLVIQVPYGVELDLEEITNDLSHSKEFAFRRALGSEVDLEKTCYVLIHTFSKLKTCIKHGSSIMIALMLLFKQ